MVALRTQLIEVVAVLERIEINELGLNVNIDNMELVVVIMSSIAINVKIKGNKGTCRLKVDLSAKKCCSTVFGVRNAESSRILATHIQF